MKASPHWHPLQSHVHLVLIVKNLPLYAYTLMSSLAWLESRVLKLQGQTALMQAASHNYLKIGEWLLLHGANVELRAADVSSFRPQQGNYHPELSVAR